MVKKCVPLIFTDHLLQVNGRVVSDWTSYWEYQKQLEIGRKDKQARAIIDKMDDVSQNLPTPICQNTFS